MNLIGFKGTKKNAGKKLGFVNVKASLVEQSNGKVNFLKNALK